MNYNKKINKSQAMYRRDYAEERNIIKGFFVGVLVAIIISVFTTNANASQKQIDLVCRSIPGQTFEIVNIKILGTHSIVVGYSIYERIDGTFDSDVNNYYMRDTNNKLKLNRYSLDLYIIDINDGQEWFYRCKVVNNKI